MRRIRFIKRAQVLGFTLAEIVELLELEVAEDGSCGDVEAKAKRTIHRIEGKIEELERMRVALQELARSCSAGLATGDCPIIEALERDPPSTG